MNTHQRQLLFSSKSTNHATPRAVFAARHARFTFERDVCATAENATCPDFISPEMDAFRTSWFKDATSWTDPSGFTTQWELPRPVPTRCWMNPPYCRRELPCAPNCVKKTCPVRGYHLAHLVPSTGDWVFLAHSWAMRGCLVDCLLPARTDQRWWLELVWDNTNNRPRDGVGVYFWKGRLRFGTAVNGAAFPSVSVTFFPFLRTCEMPDMTQCPDCNCMVDSQTMADHEAQCCQAMNPAMPVDEDADPVEDLTESD